MSKEKSLKRISYLIVIFSIFSLEQSSGKNSFLSDEKLSDDFQNLEKNLNGRFFLKKIINRQALIASVRIKIKQLKFPKELKRKVNINFINFDM